jgi:hypothetical protein
MMSSKQMIGDLVSNFVDDVLAVARQLVEEGSTPH